MKPRLKFCMETILIFTLTLFIGLSVVVATVFSRHVQENAIKQQLIDEKSMRLHDTLLRLVIRSQVLASNIESNQGAIDDFYYIAPLLVQDSSTLSILVAPGGVVTNVYPLAGNEYIVGVNLLSPGVISSETMATVQTRQLVIGGPFRSTHDTDVLVGRTAVFMPNEETMQDEFWGLTSIAIAYPEVLYEAGLIDIALMGFDYEIWYTNVYTNSSRLATTNRSEPYQDLEPTNHVSRVVEIFNTRWEFVIISPYRWYSMSITWISALIALGFSVLATGWIHTYSELRKARGRVGEITNVDLLTGIHNRTHFIYEAHRQLGRVKRTGSESHLILINLGSLKDINEEFGYASGDILLKEVCDRIGQTLRPYDLFARFGGEEFIVLVTDTSKEGVMILAERMRVAISEEPIEMAKVCMKVDVSIGVSAATPENELEKAIEYAEAAVYLAKTENNEKVMYL